MAESPAIKLPIPALPETAYTAKKGKRRKTLAEKEERRKETNRARFKSRIYIGIAFPRWRELREEKSFQTDTDLALYLLDCYDDRSIISAPSKFCYKPPGLPPLSTIEAESLSGRDEDVLSEPEDLEDDLQIQVETSGAVKLGRVEVDVEEFNDIRNSTIDWDENAAAAAANERGSEEESATLLCLRTGGDLAPPICLDLLPETSLEETVHGPMEPAEEGPAPDFAEPHKLEVMCDDDIVGHRASIAYHDSLKQLATHLILPAATCTAKHPETRAECRASQPFEIKITSRGTAAVMEWVCPSGHAVWTWSSQPVMQSQMQIGDFMLAVNTLLSGNDYESVRLLLRNMNMGTVDPAAVATIQDTYCADAIRALWEERRRDTVSKLADKSRVVLGGGRASSPGGSAARCTYAAMDSDSKEILSIVNVDNARTQQSAAVLEKEAFIQTMDTLKREIGLGEVCTDGHRQISALFSKGKYRDSGIVHSWDVWHGAKDLENRLRAAGRAKDCYPILHWIKDICNHFWLCCKEADDYQEFMSLWTSMSYHVADVHEWATGACSHGPLPKSHASVWIEEDSVAHAALVSVITNQMWLKDVDKFLPFRSTAELESFHSHVLMYVSKGTSLSPPVHEARVLLAGLDYNHHVHRPALKSRDGALVYRKVWNRKFRRWSLYTVKVPKDYAYIPDLQSATLRRWLTDHKGICRKRGMRSSDHGLVAVPGPSSQQET